MFCWLHLPVFPGSADPQRKEKDKEKENRAGLRGEIIIVLQNQTLGDKDGTVFSADFSTELFHLCSGTGPLSGLLIAQV